MSRLSLLALICAIGAVQCQYYPLSGHVNSPSYPHYMQTYPTAGHGLYAAQPQANRLGNGFVGNPGIGLRQSGTTLANIYGQPFFPVQPQPRLSPIELAAVAPRFGLSGLPTPYVSGYGGLYGQQQQYVNQGFGSVPSSYYG